MTPGKWEQLFCTCLRTAQQWCRDIEEAMGGATDTDEKPPKKDLAAMPISGLALSVRTRNCLASAEICNVSDLIKCSQEELLEIRNLGQVSPLEIVSALGAYGFSLKPH